MKKLFFAILLFSFTKLQAQVNPTWSNFQSGTGDNSDRYNAIVTDASGNLYLAGYTFNTFQDKDYLVVKMNSSGDTLWTRQYNNTAANGADKILYMALDASGNVYVTGQSDGGSINQNDIVTRAYDASGNLLWSATYNNSVSNQDDQPLGLAVDNSGNVFVTGSSDEDSTAVLNDDILTIKYNSSGVQQWVALVNGLGNATDRGGAVVADNTGGCVITGRTATAVDDDVITIKYSSTGTETWRTVYNRGFGNDRGEDAVMDGSGNIYVTGRSQNSNNYDAMTIKYNSSGVAQWTKFYNGANDDYGSFIKTDASGNVYIAGQTNTGTNFDMVTVKYNSTGAQQWVKTFGNAVQNDEDVNGILVDASGNVYVTGKSDVNSNAAIIADNFLTLKYNSAGTLQWSVYLDGTATNSDDIAEGFVLDATATNLYVCGGSQNTTTQKDATVVKYDVSTGTATWTKSYNGKGDFTDKVQGIIIDSKKNIYITGYVMNPDVRKDLFVAKLNSSGNTKWFVTYDFSQQDDEGKAITLDTIGNVYVCGSSIGSGTSDDYVTIKLDSLGNILWSSRYDFNSDNDIANAIVVNKYNGNVFVTGYSDANISSKVTNYDIATVKYSSTGNQLAVVRYNGAANGIDRPIDMSIIPTSVFSTTFLVITGRSWNGSNYDILTLKYNATLGQQWAATYAGTGNKDDEARDLVLESTTGDVYVAGSTGTASNGLDLLAIKYNSSGVQQWAFTNNGAGNYNDVAYGALVTSSAAYVTGRTAPSAAGDTADLITFKLDKSTGASLWSTIYKGTGGALDRGNALGADQFGNIYTTGQSKGVSNLDMITQIYDSGGKIKWTARYDGPGAGDDEGKVMALDAAGYVYVGGFATGTGTKGYDAATLKYCPPPPANAGSDVTICSGASTQLSASGGTNYSWSPATKLSSTIISNPVASPTSTISYVVSVDNGLGCAGKDTVVVTVNPLPNVTVTADGPLSFCAGDSVILSVPTCTCTYQWKKGANNISGATTNSYTAKTKATYKVIVTTSLGCSKTSKGQKVQIICKGETPVADQVNELQIAASPNPTSSVFSVSWISASTEPVNIEAFNVLGTRVYSQFGVSNSTVRFGEELPAGIYFVNVTQGSVQRVLKVVKEN